MKSLLLSLRVGIFLGWRQIRRSGKGTSALIVAIMTLTFLNLVAVSGILVGLIEGSAVAFRTQYSGDLLIGNLPTKNYVLETPKVLEILSRLPEVKAYSPRYIAGGSIEADYKNVRRPADKPDQAASSLVGIDPVAENSVSDLKKYMIEGSFLSPDDEDQVVLGARLLSQYLTVPIPSFETVDNVHVGSKILLKVNGFEREVTVKGILMSKIQEVARRVFIPEKLFRKMIDRTDYNVDEIAVKLQNPLLVDRVKEQLLQNGVGRDAAVQTWEEAQGPFFKDITDTFGLLGNMFGSLGLTMATITIFIVIFINAITRKKFIGIMKGIGISPFAIEFSYVFQSFVYALVGVGIGMLMVYGYLEPHFMAHPINFPFSDGILVAPLASTGIRVLLLFVATMLAGYIPSKIVISRNTLDSILGR